MSSQAPNNYRYLSYTVPPDEAGEDALPRKVVRQGSTVAFDLNPSVGEKALRKHPNKMPTSLFCCGCGGIRTAQQEFPAVVNTEGNFTSMREAVAFRRSRFCPSCQNQKVSVRSRVKYCQTCGKEIVKVDYLEGAKKNMAAQYPKLSFHPQKAWASCRHHLDCREI